MVSIMSFFMPETCAYTLKLEAILFSSQAWSWLMSPVTQYIRNHYARSARCASLAELRSLLQNISAFVFLTLHDSLLLLHHSLTLFVE